MPRSGQEAAGPEGGSGARRRALATSAAALAALLGACAESATPDGASVEPPPVLAGSAEPHLVAEGDDVLMSWLEPAGGEPDRPGAEYQLRVARLTAAGAWVDLGTPVRRPDLFVNWADFPSALQVEGGAVVAQWLQRGPNGGYDYGIRVASAAGREWGGEWTPHEDDTPTEHGFVSMVALGGDRVGMAWLDGRQHHGAEEEGREPQMAVRYREATPVGPETAETVLDVRTCDCCQTDATVVGGSVAVVYRDRSADEVRDIAIVRLTESGWTEPRIIHEDGWVISACPVNGPAISARGERVAVAWFTAAGGKPAVRASFSDDGGATFSRPVSVDEGSPVGRVDIEVLEDGSAAVSWIEGAGSEGAELRVRVVTEGGAGEPRTIAHTSQARASGFPQMVTAGGRLIFAWTDVEADRVRVGAIGAGPAALPRP